MSHLKERSLQSWCWCSWLMQGADHALGDLAADEVATKGL